MSDPLSVRIKCHHSGVFKYEEDGTLNFVDGLLEEFVVNGICIFEDVIMKMVHKTSMGNMWYKLPYEDYEDRKPLFEDTDANKKKMNAAGRWMRELDVFIEKVAGEPARAAQIESDDIERDVPVEHVGENELEPPVEIEVEATEIEGANDEAQESEDETYHADQEEVVESEDEYQISNASDDGNDFDRAFEEDLEVFRNENYEDEVGDEDEMYPDTEHSSGDEEEQAERMYGRGELDGVFGLRQTFYDREEFKKQVMNYILKTRRNVIYDRWEKKKLSLKCGGKGCGWRIYCSFEPPIKQWMVKVYVNRHTCHPTGKCKLIKSPAIADIMLEQIRKEPEMSAPTIKEEFRKLYNIIISPEQAKIARRIALDKLQAESNDQFARVRDYEMELLRANPGSSIEINTTTKPNGAKAFFSMYICFKQLRVAWKAYCRPVIGLDGTFLKHPSLQGVILTAIGRDPNNQIYPIAWVVVTSESKENWQWFIQRLKHDLELGGGDNVTIISDQHHSLIHGVSAELPRAEHRACARHIYSNLKKTHKSDTLKPLFWLVASSYNEADYDRNLETFKKFDPRAAEDLLKKNPATWCRAFFRTWSSCADTHNNFTESFNRTLKIARKKPFIQMLELIRRDAMQRVATRYKTAMKETGLFTKKARKEIEKSCEEAQYCYSFSSTADVFEIVEFGNGYRVSLPSRSCTCRKWDLTGIPCRHAISAIRENGKEVDDYISGWYATSKWQALYMDGLQPVNGPKFWKLSGAERIEAPPYKRPPGRPKGKARIKGLHESPKKNQTKVGRKGRIGHCGLCGGEGHNSRKCPHESEESRAKRRRLTMEGQAREEEESHEHDVSSTAPPATQTE